MSAIAMFVPRPDIADLFAAAVTLKFIQLVLAVYAARSLHRIVRAALATRNRRPR
jgi:hypothetical protein